MEWFKSSFVRSAHRLINITVKIYFRISVEGKSAIPDAGSVLVVANHSSYLDVPILGHALFEKLNSISWIISKENYRLWYLKWLFFIFRVVVVNGTIDKVKRELTAQRWVAIFPQGAKRWYPPGESRRQNPGKGAAVIALTTGVTILPVAIMGTNKVLPPRSFKFQPRYPITVRIGKPLHFPKIEESRINKKMLEETIQEIMDKIRKLV